MNVRRFAVLGAMVAGGVSVLIAQQALVSTTAQAAPGAAPAAPAAAPATGKPAETVAPAPAGAYTVDGVHASVVFRAKHNQVSWFYGTFENIAGSFDLRDGGSIDIVVKADSVNSRNANRDKHLKKDDFFGAEEHPDITFKASSVKSAGTGKFTAEGTLSFHGVSKPLTVTIEATGTGKGRQGEDLAGMLTTFTIKRSDYGSTYGVPAISDEVELTVSLEGVKK